MSLSVFEKLYAGGMISEISIEKIRNHYSYKSVSLNVELRAVLYLSILLISGGIGILVYKNIELIGHAAILTALAAAFGGCFYYCLKYKPAFSWREVKSPSVQFDYILLLGALLLIIFIGYLQSQFLFFGSRWGLATFIPMCLLFFIAYYADHKGVLSMAITMLTAWVGVTMNRSTMYGLDLMGDRHTIIAAILLSIFLILLSIVIKSGQRKQHFHTVYHQFGTHIGFIALIAAIVAFKNIYLIWLLALLLAGFYHFRKAFRENNVYYLVITSLYCYAGFSYILSVHVFEKLSDGSNELYANLFYYLLSGIAMAYFLNQITKKIKSDDRL